MSQRAVFVEVNGNLLPEVLHGMPDYDDCVSAARDMVEPDDLEPGDTCAVHAVWYEIGEGESDTDTFFPEETLLKWQEEGVLADEVEKKRGYSLEEVQNDTTYVHAHDIE